MTKLTTILPTVLFATFAPKLVVASMYFTGYQNDDCTGDEVGTFPASQGDKRYEEQKFTTKPKALTDCNKGKFRVGTTSMDDHFVKMECPKTRRLAAAPAGGDKKQIKISTYRGKKGECSEDNMMGYYIVAEDQMPNLLAGACAKAKRTMTWGDKNEERPDTVSVMWTGFDSVLLGTACDMSTFDTTGTDAKPAESSSGLVAKPVETKTDVKIKTTAGPDETAKSGLPHSFFAVPLAIFVGAGLL